MCLPKAPRRGRQRNGLGERIDVVQLAGFDQRSDDGAVLGAAVGACEERIFPDGAFDGAGVELDTTFRRLEPRGPAGGAAPVECDYEPALRFSESRRLGAFRL